MYTRYTRGLCYNERNTILQTYEREYVSTISLIVAVQISPLYVFEGGVFATL